MTSRLDAPALEPAILVIFGITGDLSRRKLLPALYHLIKNDLLDKHTVVLGITRRQINVDELIADVELCVNEVEGICDPKAVEKLKSKLKMVRMDITESNEYARLKIMLDDIEEKNGLCMNRLYYLSLPPQVIGSIVTLLGEQGLNASCQHNVASTRLLIEKPFGYDLNSAHELINIISKQFSEDQIYRIDHYLAKETVQNIIFFRFNNIFEEVWNNQHISHILITAIETIGIEGRTIFYEQVGALRDIIQSHLLQLLAVATLDLPRKLNSTSLHQAKLDLLKSIDAVPADKIPELTLRGQYKTYLEEIGKDDSSVETFAAIRLSINSERWKNVPILLRTGKAMAKKLTEIRIVFKPVRDGSPSNILVFRLQPSEGIELDLLVKKPGFEEELQSTSMDFSYEQAFDDHGHPDAYERVLVDAVRGDHTLFSTSQEVIQAWRVVEPILEGWARGESVIEIYKDGSYGPEKSLSFAKKNGTTWDG